jgi:hypothetical protein
MPNLFDSENRRIIKDLNAGLGTKHRTTPYDLNKPADLKHALMMAAGAYSDYRHYLHELYGIAENFDESLENYDTIAWINQDSEKSDGEANKCADALNVAISTFEELTDRAREDFIKTLAITFSAPPEVQRAALGRPYYISAENMDAEIEKLIEIIDEAEYQYSIPANYESLLALMSGEWAKGK